MERAGPEFGRIEDGKVEKPWGYELRWAITDRYAGKVLHVKRGEALSLQYHERKDEYQYVVRGAVDVEIGGPNGALTTRRMIVGDTVHITPGTRHRITAVEDTDIFEVSTPEIDDVVRLEDRYGRV
ncbi:MAG TPA: cupin domain-containing protein [Candidatus Limnocylindrales bacterium]|nr:cupin domain-containing protein [Candidatus Limnocylindrales bacterium]